jgi:hypothetical protein
VARAIAIAVQCGDRQQGETLTTDEGVHAAVRDPDGNTVEIDSGPRPVALKDRK